MNDKALDDAYRMFVQSGYRKSKAEFYALLASNPNAFNDAYKLFSNSGYKGSQDEFATLLGVGQGLEVGPKKKDATELPSAGGSLVPSSNSDVTDVKPSDRLGFVAEDVDASLNEAYQLADSLITPDLIGMSEEELTPLLRDNFSRFGLTFEQPTDGVDQIIARSNDGQFSERISLRTVPGQPNYQEQANRLKRFIQTAAQPDYKPANEDYLSKVTRARQLRKTGRINPNGTRSTVMFASVEADGKHYVVPTLFPASPYQYSSNPSDWVEAADIRTAFDMAQERGEVFEFDTAEEADKFARGDWKDVNALDYEADQFFNERGLDYISLKNARNEYERLSDTIEMYEDMDGDDDDWTVYQGETVKYGELIDRLTEERDSYADVVLGDDVRLAFDEFSVELAKAGKEITQEGADRYRQAAAYTDAVMKASAEQFGVMPEELPNIQYNSPEAEAQAEQIYTEYLLSKLDERNAKALIEQGASYFDERTNKNITGEFTNGFLEGVWEPMRQGFQEGNAGLVVTLLSSGLDVGGYDLDTESGRQRAIADIVKAKTAAQGPQQRALMGYVDARTTQEKMAYALESPAEFLIGLFGQSMGQLLPVGAALVPSFALAGALANVAVTGIFGAFGGPLGWAVVAGAAKAGALQGMRAGFAAANFAVEYQSAFFEAMERNGLDAMNPKDVERAIMSEEVWNEAKVQGLARGIPIAVADYLSAGLAGRIFYRPLASTTTRMGSLLTEQLVFGPGSEAVGEAAAQMTYNVVQGKAAGDIDWTEVQLEGLGGGPSNVFNLAVNTYRNTRSDYNSRLASDMESVTFVNNLGASDQRITSWVNRQQQLGAITPEQAQNALESVGLRREANKLLTGETEPSKPPKTKVRGRLMQLMATKRELEQRNSPSLREAIANIDNEISEIVTTGKVPVGGIDLKGLDKRVSGRNGKYRWKGEKVTREVMLQRLSEATEEELTEGLRNGDIVVSDDPAFNDILNGLRDAIQEQTTDEVSVPDQPEVGEQVGEEVRSPEELTPEEEAQEAVDDEVAALDDLINDIGTQPEVTPEVEPEVEPEVQPEVEPEVTPEVEPEEMTLDEKRADIERRRQEEIGTEESRSYTDDKGYTTTVTISEEKGRKFVSSLVEKDGKTISQSSTSYEKNVSNDKIYETENPDGYEYSDAVQVEREGSAIDAINAKYDAELAALEPEVEQEQRVIEWSGEDGKFTFVSPSTGLTITLDRNRDGLWDVGRENTADRSDGVWVYNDIKDLETAKELAANYIKRRAEKLGNIPEVPAESKTKVEPDVSPEVEPEVQPEVTPEVEPEVEPEVTPEAEAEPEVQPDENDPYNVSEEDKAREDKKKDKWIKVAGGYEFRSSEGYVYRIEKSGNKWTLSRADWNGKYYYGSQGATIDRTKLFADTSDTIPFDSENTLREAKEVAENNVERIAGDRKQQKKKARLFNAPQILKDVNTPEYEGELAPALEAIATSGTMTELFNALKAVIGLDAVPALPVYEALAKNPMLNPFQRMIAESIAERLKNAKTTIFFSLTDEDGVVPGKNFTTLGGAFRHYGPDAPSAMGAIIQVENPVKTYAASKTADPASYAGESALMAMLHEGVHAVTAFELSDKNSPFTKEVRAIVDTAIKYIKANKDTVRQKHSIFDDFVLGKNNTFQDIDEVVAWGLTSEEMQDLLRDIPYSTDMTVWDKFVQAVRKALGLPDRPEVTNALEGLLNAYAQQVAEAKDNAKPLDADTQQETETKEGLRMQEDALKQEIVDERNNLKDAVTEIREQYKGKWSSKDGVMTYTLNNGTRYEITKRDEGDFNVTYYDENGLSYPEVVPTKNDGINYVKESVTETRDDAIENAKDEAQSLIDDLKEQLKEVRADLKKPRTSEMREGETPLAPNGMPSLLSPELHRVVRTEAFKSWFGDWENDPENASKVVDMNGEPKVVYHGSPDNNISIFDEEKAKEKRVSGLKEFGYFFTDDPTIAEIYAEKSDTGTPTVYPLFLNIRNMHTFDAKEKAFNQGAWRELKVDIGYKWAAGIDAVEALAGRNTAAPDARVDGIKADNIVDMMVSESSDVEPGEVYVVWFDSAQNIKLADGSNTTFNGGSVRVAEMREGVEPSTRAIIAPYFNTSYDNVADAQKARKSEGYKKFVESLNSIAKSMGFGVKVEDSIGGYRNEAGEDIVELSVSVTMEGVNIAQAEEFAAIMGALAPEVQEATIASEYVEPNSIRHNANEYTFKVSDVGAAIQAIKNAGFDGFSVDDKNRTISVIDVLDFADERLEEKLTKFVKELSEKNVRYAEESVRAVDSRYIDKESRKKVIRRISSEGVFSGQVGEKLLGYIQEAVKNDAVFQGLTPQKYLDEKAKPGNRLFNEPLPEVQEIADRYYQESFGRQRPRFEGTRELNVERAKRIAKAYEKMPDDPTNPRVNRAYTQMAKETEAQYEAMIAAGYFVEVNNEEPYGNSAEMIEDLRANKRMKIFSTESGFGDEPITDKQRAENPLLARTKHKDKNGVPLLVNDLFRAVHDFFGHAELGNSFGPKGEENAWNVHVRMYSQLAAAAMTSETRGQNSYVNFSGVNERVNKLRQEAAALRDAGRMEEAEALVGKIYDEISFAEQKVGLLPKEFWVPDGAVGGFDTTGSLRTSEMREGIEPGDADSPMRFEEGLDIYDVIQRGRDAGFKDASIVEYLRRNGFTVREAKAAMEVPYDMTTSMPRSFGNVPGGAKAGFKMFQEIKAELAKFARKKGVDAADVRAEAQRLLSAMPEFKQSSDTMQKMMLAEMNANLQGKRNKKVSDAISRMRADLKQRMIGARELRAAQKEVRKFIAANLPEKMRNKANVKSLLKRLADSNVATMPVIMSEVIDILDAMAKTDAKLTAKVEAMKTKLNDARTNAKALKIAKAEARIFIRKNLPVGKYGKRVIGKLITMATNATPDTIGKDGQLTENSISNVMRKVIDEVNQHTVGKLFETIDGVFKGQFVTMTGDRIRGKISPEAQDRLNAIRDLMADRKADIKAISDKIAAIQDRMSTLNEQALTEDTYDEMVGLHLALAYNEALLLEDNEAGKVAALEAVAEELVATFVEGRNELKERLRARHLKYNELKARAFKDITGGEVVDFNDPASIERARVIVEKMQISDEQKSQITKILLAPFEGIDKLLLRAEDLAGILDRISKLPGEIFGGDMQEIIRGNINEANREFLGGRNILMNIIEQKSKEVFGKNYRSVMEENGRATETYYIDPARARELEAQIAEETDKKAKRKLQEELDSLSKPISQNEMYYLYNQFKDPANHAGFKAKFGEQYEAIMAEIESKLDPKVREWADWQVDVLFPSLYDRYNEVYRNIYDTNMPWNEHYAGRIIREGDFSDDKVGFLDSTKYRAYVGSASTKLRKRNSRAIKSRNGDSALASYLNEMEFFRAYAEPMRDITKVINDPTIKKSIESFAGTDNYAVLKVMIDRVMTREVNSTDAVENIEMLSNAFVTSRLGFSPQVFMKQATSALAFQSFIGTRNWLKYSAKGLTGGIGSMNRYWKEMMANSDVLQDRYENSNITRVLENYSDKRSVGPLRVGGRVILSAKMNENAVEVMMWLVKQGDKMGVMGGIANYLYYKEKYLADNPNATEQEAMKYAADKVADQADQTQQGSSTQTKDVFQTSPSKVLRLFSMFASSARALYRMEANAFRQLYRAATGKAYKGTVRGAMRDIMLYHVALPMAVQYIGSAFFDMLRNRDDEDKDEMLRAALLGNINSVFIIGDILTIAADTAQGKPWADKLKSLPAFTFASDIMSNITKAIEYGNKAEALTKRSERDKKEEYEIKQGEHIEKAMIELGSMATGLPVGNLAKFGDNLSKIGEAEDNGEAIMRLLNYSEYQIQRGKPEEKPRNSISKRDMKLYFPEMYNDLYGKGGTLYDIEQDKKELRQEMREMEREARGQ